MRSLQILSGGVRPRCGAAAVRIAIDARARLACSAMCIIVMYRLYTICVVNMECYM